MADVEDLDGKFDSQIFVRLIFLSFLCLVKKVRNENINRNKKHTSLPICVLTQVSSFINNNLLVFAYSVLLF